MIGTKQINETDHRIRLNDAELVLICRALRAFPLEEHTPDERKKRRLCDRLTALGCYRR